MRGKRFLSLKSNGVTYRATSCSARGLVAITTEDVLVTYWRYWRLNSAPFSNEYSQAIFMGASIEEAVARIDFLVSNRRSVGVLVGPPGVGKSSVLRYCHNHPPRSPEVPSVQVNRVSMMGLQGGEVVNQLAVWLTGDSSIQSMSDSWKSLCDYFRAAAREGVQTVLLVDDTESASNAAEADLCRLMSTSFPLTIVFAIDSEMVAQVCRSLVDRVELQIELPSWDFMQTAEFLLWSSQQLGRQDPIFTESAVQSIHQQSGGIARKVVQLADLALVAGAVAHSRFIDSTCIDQVACELPKMQVA
jgi:type II secretory pathway predicted ATPase ExeA